MFGILLSTPILSPAISPVLYPTLHATIPYVVYHTVYHRAASMSFLQHFSSPFCDYVNAQNIYYELRSKTGCDVFAGNWLDRMGGCVRVWREWQPSIAKVLSNKPHILVRDSTVFVAKIYIEREQGGVREKWKWTQIDCGEWDGTWNVHGAR